MPIDPKSAILQKMLGGMNNPAQRQMMDTPQYMMDGRTGMDEEPYSEGQGFGGIPEEILLAAEKLYLEEYGEEGFGGDASMEMVEKIAREMMAGGMNPEREMQKDGGGDAAQRILEKLLGGQ